MCRWEGGARSLKGARREGEISRDLATGGGGARSLGIWPGGRNPWDTGTDPTPTPMETGLTGELPVEKKSVFFLKELKLLFCFKLQLVQNYLNW